MRRRSIDWARAIAILVMVEAHALDAWTRFPARGSQAFKNLQILGGFAAPLFLWLAGLALVLSAERTAERTGSLRTATATVVRRGLEIFILAFLFRLQTFIVSPGGSLVMVFRVDILNIMGPAMVAAALLWGLTRGVTGRTAAFAVVATGIAMVTPIIRSAEWVDGLPRLLQWYIRPSADYNTFTMFPWAGFVFAGAAVGAVMTAARGARAERRLQIALAMSGAAITALGFVTAARPSIYAHSSFWTTSPTFFAIRLGILMLVVPAAYASEKLLGRWGVTLAWLDRFGRSSLFVYWIHVELVYGYATWPLRHHLALWQLGLAYTAFTVALYGAVVLRDRLVGSWQARGQAQGPADALPA